MKKSHYETALFICLIIVMSCQYSEEETGTYSNQDDSSNRSKIQSIAIDSVNQGEGSFKNQSICCNERLQMLIKTSTLDSQVTNLTFLAHIDNLISGVALVKLTVKNKERGDDVIISWVEVDSNKKELRDVTIDPDLPIKLKYNDSLFQKVITLCFK